MKLRVRSLIPKKGDRFVVKTSFKTIVMTHWFAPFTGGVDGVLPEGLVFVIDHDPVPGATAVGAKPDDPARWEAEFIDAATRADKKYGGYSLSITFTALATFCERAA